MAHNHKIGKRNHYRFVERKISTVILNLAIGIFMVGANFAYAQSFQSEVEILQEAFGLEKKVVVAKFMDLEASESGFWKIYEEYEAARKKLGKERIQIIADYASSYPNLSDEKIQELFKRTQAVKESFDDLQASYFKKMRKEVGISKAAQFWQLESYFSALIQANIYTQIPFIGEHTDRK